MLSTSDGQIFSQEIDGFVMLRSLARFVFAC